MGLAGLFLWVFLFLAAGVGASLLLAGGIVVVVGLVRRSKKIAWLGTFMTCLAGLTLSIPTFIWLETFQPRIHATSIFRIAWIVGLISTPLAFTAFVRSASKQYRWN
jgi:hypothetical protein